MEILSNVLPAAVIVGDYVAVSRSGVSGEKDKEVFIN